jgi:hypothetical protein
MIIILPYSATPNPLGLPGEYPVNAYPEWPDKDPLPSGYIEVTKEEWERRISQNRSAVQAIIDAQRTTEATAERNKLDAFRQLFQEGRSIDQNWATATNAQKLELGRLAFRILWLARSSLAEIIKPDAS